MRRSPLLAVLCVALAAPLCGAPVAAADGSAPVVSAVSPGSGPEVGGTQVTITGSGFTGATAVAFGSAPASFRVDSDTTISATSPPGHGSVHVTVSAPAGESALSGADTFDYIAPPVVAALTPDSGSVSGDTVVTITGSGFFQASAVLFGDTPAKVYTVDSDSQITATAPEGGGSVHVTVAALGGTSSPTAADLYTYRIEVTGLDPGSGPTSGGARVRVHGIGFSIATVVRFGRSAAGYVVLSDNEILAVEPAGAASVDVTVVTPRGTSPVVPAARFTYVSPSASAQPTVGAAPLQPPSSPSGPGASPASSGALRLAAVSPPMVTVRRGTALVLARVRVDRTARLVASVLGRTRTAEANAPGSVSIRFAFPARNLRRGARYVIRVSAVGADGTSAALLVPFRLR